METFDSHFAKACKMFAEASSEYFFLFLYAIVSKRIWKQTNRKKNKNQDTIKTRRMNFHLWRLFSFTTFLRFYLWNCLGFIQSKVHFFFHFFSRFVLNALRLFLRVDNNKKKHEKCAVIWCVNTCNEFSFYLFNLYRNVIRSFADNLNVYVHFSLSLSHFV